MSKGHILLLTRHYPPAVSGGARRPLVLATGLRARGWRVTIASPSPPEGNEDWIETPHPAGVRGEAAMAESASRKTGWIEVAKRPLRTLLFWPDNDMSWALMASRTIARSKIRPDWVISTSPPESAHLGGRLIQRRTGARWVAEMRDSWIADPLRPELRNSAVRRAAERLIARRLLSESDRVVAVSEAIAAEAASWLKPGAPPPVVIGHFAEPTSEIYSFRGPGPHLLYTGRFSLSHPERTISRLLGSFERIRARSPGAHLHLVGMLTEAEKSELAAHAVSAFVTLHGEVPHRTALAMQSASDALILYQQSTAALPGKLSEYLLATAPILVLGDGEWRSRLIGTPHFPVEEAEHALNSPRRQPTDATAAAINAYEAVLLGAVGEPRTERQS